MVGRYHGALVRVADCAAVSGIDPYKLASTLRRARPDVGSYRTFAHYRIAFETWEALTRSVAATLPFAYQRQFLTECGVYT